MDISDAMDAAQSMQVQVQVHEHASADADLLIVQTAISTTDIGNKPTVLVADDTDILIPLCYHWVRAPRGVYSSSQNLAKLPRSNPGAGICQMSSQHWAQEYVITSFLYMPFSDVIHHHMYMALENQLHLSCSVTIKTLRIRLRSLQIQTVQRQMSLK